MKDLELADRINMLITHFDNGNKSAFCRRIDIKESTLRSYLKGSIPHLSVIRSIILKTKIESEWLFFGTGKMIKKSDPIEQLNTTKEFDRLIRYVSNLEEKLRKYEQSSTH